MSSMKVLVVDAEVEARRRTVDALEGLTGVFVVGAVSDLRGALRTLHDGRPDLIIAEVAFPDGDIVELIAAARVIERPAQVVVLTTVDEREQGPRCLAAGAERYLRKRASADELTELVRQLARARRARARPPGDA